MFVSLSYPLRYGWIAWLDDALLRTLAYNLVRSNMSELDRHELETRMMDDLKSMGCNISVNTTFDGAFFVQITLLHGDQMCGHTGRNTNQHFNDATKGAIRNILRAASGSKCGVETKKLEELVS